MGTDGTPAMKAKPTPQAEALATLVKELAAPPARIRFPSMATAAQYRITFHPPKC